MNFHTFPKTAVLLFMFFITFETAFSQVNWQPAYIVNLQGDTLNGFIDYWNWKRSPVTISFKNSNDKIIQYKPSDIKSFKVNDENYLSAVIEVETSPLVTKDLNQVSDVSLRIDTGFIQVLVRGNKSLYRYTTINDKEQFYISGVKGIELLIYKRFLKRKDQLESALSIIENKKFVGQLILYFQDCAGIQSKFENTRYNAEDLVDIFEYYYACTRSRPQYQIKIEKTLFNKGLLMGVSNSWLRIDNTSTALKYMKSEFFNSSTNPAAGFYIDIILPKIFRKWSVNNEFIVSRAVYSGTYEEYWNPDHYNIITTNLRYNYLTMNNMIRYKRNYTHFSLYGNVGIYNSLIIDKINKKTTYTKFYSSERTEEAEAFATKNREFGLLIGAGANYKRYLADLRYTTGKGMSNLDNIGIYSNRIFLLLGYRF